MNLGWLMGLLQFITDRLSALLVSLALKCTIRTQCSQTANLDSAQRYLVPYYLPGVIQDW